MRTAPLLLAGLLAAMASAQDLTKQITYTTKAASTRQVLADLSKHAGVRLQPEPDLEGEPLILRLDHVPLREVMDKIAGVFAADWVDHHGYWQLERSEETVDAIKQRVLQERTKAFRASIDELTSLEQNQKPIDAAEATAMVKDAYAIGVAWKANQSIAERQFDFGCRLPSMRLAVKELARLDPAELAAIGNNRRVVFTSEPTAMQRPLPPFDPADIRDYREQCGAIHEAMSKLKLDFSYGHPNIIMDEGLSGDAQSVTYKPSRIIAVATRTGRTVQIAFTVYDENGIPRVSDDESLGTPYGAFYLKRKNDGKLGAEAQKSGYSLGPIAEELATRLGKDATEMRSISKPTLDALLDPENIDPLAIATSDTLLIGAEKEGLNVVALPTEESESNALKCAKTGKTTLERFKASLDYTNTSLTTDGGWLTMKPLDPLDEAKDRVPREALKTYYHGLLSDGLLTVGNFADLRYACSRDSGLEIPVVGTEELLGDNEWFTMSHQTVDTMRFYGSLSDPDRDAAKKGVLTIPLGQLSAGQKDIVDSLLYDSSQLAFTDEKPSPSHPIWMPERTDILPNGLPANTTITVTDRSTQAIFCRERSPDGDEYDSFPMDIEFAVSQMLSAQHPEMFPNEMHVPIVGWMLGGQRTLSIKVLADDRYKVEDSYQEASKPKQKPMPLNDFLASLPEELKTQIQGEMSKQLLGMQKRPATTSGEAAPPTSSPPHRS